MDGMDGWDLSQTTTTTRAPLAVLKSIHKLRKMQRDYIVLFLFPFNHQSVVFRNIPALKLSTLTMSIWHFTLSLLFRD